MSETCPKCGQPLVPSDLILPPIKTRILELVRQRPGIDAETLRTLVWANDPAGGPETLSNLHVHIHQINVRLASHGLAVRGSRFYGYRVRSCVVASLVQS
jgi:hypothetical protein